MDWRRKMNLRQEWRKYLVKRQKNKCNICGVKFTWKNPPTFDHIVPLCEGGKDHLENGQALCEKCHIQKDKHLSEKDKKP
jgi:5-methylcytosine-specific restriction endonuclease McrA